MLTRSVHTITAIEDAIRDFLQRTRKLPQSHPQQIEWVRLRISPHFLPVLKELIRLVPTPQRPVAGDALVVLARAGLSRRLRGAIQMRRKHGYSGYERKEEHVTQEGERCGCAFQIWKETRDLYDLAARAEGITRAEWIRSRLDAALDAEIEWLDDHGNPIAQQESGESE